MKTAIILTARKERDCGVPYPLMPFGDGICLIDRTIGILRDLDYNQIVIVVGFCANMFTKYEAADIQIVENKDYEFTASMGSLALCKRLVKNDFLLLEGDTFYERQVIEQLDALRSGNCICTTEESGSGDECYVETKAGYLTNLTKDRHRVYRFEGEMIGASRIAIGTYKKMIERWETSGNPMLNYEYLLLDVTDVLDRPCIHFKNLIWGDVDTQEDFKRLENDIYRRLCRKENPFDEDNIRNHVHVIFPDYKEEDIRIEQIGGMSNMNFKVHVNHHQYVLRVPGNGSTGMVQRENEEQNSALGCEIGISPSIRYFDSTKGIKLTDFIEDAETLNNATIQRFENIQKVAEIYQKLHHSHFRQNNEFNIFNEIIKYEQLLKAAGGKMFKEWDYFRKDVFSLKQRLNKLGVDLKPCHNDAVAENFIKSSDGKLYLIDWEYSGMNDPIADIAALFLESSFTEDNQELFYKCYFGNEIPDNTQEKILCYQILWDCLWAIWTLIKEAKGDDFGTYGYDRFQRAITNYQKLIMTTYNNERQ